MRFQDNQTETNQVCTREFVLGTIREVLFQYILDDNGYRSCWDCYSAFSSPFLSSIFGVSTLIYTTYLPSSLPYTWIVDGLCWYLSHQPPLEVFWGGCKATIILCRGHFLINEAKELAGVHSMRWWQFFPRYFGILLCLLFLQCLSIFPELYGSHL